MRVAVIGGGIAGATAAMRLSAGGAEVVLLESSERLGGLVVSFEVAGTPLECFYHHVFPHERHIRELIDELGLSSRLGWFPSTMAVLSRGRLWPFTTPLDIMRFGPLRFGERLHMGIGGLRLQRWDDWESLDNVPAHDWLRDACGAAAVRELWGPLLRAKFGPAAQQVPAAWMWGRFEQRRGARKGAGERLGYLRGGFRQLFDALASRLTASGVDIRTATRVASIDVGDRRVTGITTDSSEVEVDAVLYTGALPGVAHLVPAEHVDPTWASARGMSVLCSVIETDRPLSQFYWTNVCDDELGIGAIIEHTNLVPAADYDGRHITYLGRYFTKDEAIAAADPHAQAATWVNELERIYPGFDASHVVDVHAFRAPYAAPLVSLGYRSQIPDLRSEIAGLYLATTAQIYPADRGMSEGVRIGGEAAAAIQADAR
jgi:protoporphyrinogen oxidase